jgi:hypothetical protein
VVLTVQKRWKPTSFDGFLKKPWKVVENHHFWRFFEKTAKSGGKPPVLTVFWKNREKWWKTTTFDGFSKKPPKVVENHQFWAYFEKPPKIGHFCLKFGQIKLFFGWETTIFLVFLKNRKNGGKPPVLPDFSKIRQNRWFSTTFDGFFEKPSKVVENHRFCRFFRKTGKMVENHQNMAIFGASQNMLNNK